MIAHNLMIDHLRRRQIVSIDTIADLEALNIAADAGPERLTSARQELKMLQMALDNVPARQREVIVRRKVEGLSQREVAVRMGDAVERQLSQGIRYLADAVVTARTRQMWPSQKSRSDVGDSAERPPFQLTRKLRT